MSPSKFDYVKNSAIARPIRARLSSPCPTPRGQCTNAYRSSPSAAADAPPPPPLFLPPHLSHLSQHLNHLSQPFFPLKDFLSSGWGCPCCPKEEARSTSVAELRRKAHEHSAALLQQLASFQQRALLPLHLPPLPLQLMPHENPPPSAEPPKHLES
ncbi:hypothetical protein JYU34_001909 [Plutella xylostella]|uniref:OAR domain-containing protein n=1 Tax=Plutella xylostella TaxID=51655 RepID=A0ABQ7R529_PLUXY|nr:hypothetical protein JYU34_001909 [Plutella xylostella]